MLGTKWPSITSTWIEPGAAALDGAAISLAEPREVGGQDRRREDHDAGLLTSRLSAARELTRWPAGGLCRSTIPGATPG